MLEQDKKKKTILTIIIVVAILSLVYAEQRAELIANLISGWGK